MIIDKKKVDDKNKRGELEDLKINRFLFETWGEFVFLQSTGAGFLEWNYISKLLYPENRYTVIRLHISQTLISSKTHIHRTCVTTQVYGGKDCLEFRIEIPDKLPPFETISRLSANPSNFTWHNIRTIFHYHHHSNSNLSLLYNISIYNYQHFFHFSPMFNNFILPMLFKLFHKTLKFTNNNFEFKKKMVKFFFLLK